MVGDFQASLYDLFGYLLPGFVATAALGLLWHAIFAPTAPIPLDSLASPFLGSFALVIAYLLGHLCHAIGNKFATSPEDMMLKTGGKGSLELLTAVDERLTRRHGVDATTLKPVEKYGILDEEGMFGGQRGDRDVYIYREGFYRGMAVGSLMLSVGVVLHLCLDRTCFDFATSSTCLSRGEFVAVLLLSGAYAWGSIVRMRRFGRYRVERAVYRWLAATAPETKSVKRKPVTSGEANESSEAHG